MRTMIVTLAACLILASGCGSPKPALEPVAPAAEEIRLPERMPYVLGVGDKLEIKFPYYPGYNVFVVVRSDGMVSIPIVGEVKAEGMRPMELQNLIKARYAEVVTQPEVAVMVAEPSSQLVFVLGEVRLPSSYPLRSQMTVLDAIAGAGGVTYLGKKDSIVLIRQSADGTFGGTKVNLDDILKGHGRNLPLLARDVVYVPISSIGRVDLFVEHFFSNLSPAWYFYIAGRDVLNPEGRFILGR